LDFEMQDGDSQDSRPNHLLVRFVAMIGSVTTCERRSKDVTCYAANSLLPQRASLVTAGCEACGINGNLRDHRALVVRA